MIRLRALFRRGTVEQELSEELRFHFEQSVDKLMRAGLTRQEAERRSRLALGGMEQTKEECRRARGVTPIEVLWKDAVYAMRMLRKGPGFTLAVVLSLALGIGANTAIFSLIDAVMWRSLPVTNPESLHTLVHGQPGRLDQDGFTYQQFRALSQDTETLAGIAAYGRARLNVSIDGGIEPAAEGQLVSPDYFPLLGVQPALGRAIGEEQGQPVAMISHGFWKRRFASDPAILGRTVRISGLPFTVIGVTPPEFFGVEVGMAPDLFVPIAAQPVVMPVSENLLENPILYSTWLNLIARLKPGIPAARASAAMLALYRSSLPEGLKSRGLEREELAFTPAATGLSSLRRQFSESLVLLMAVVGVVLLIACANIANLLLARAAARKPEFLLRLAIGAGRARLVSQLLVESLLLAASGGVLGVFFARWATRFLMSFLSDGRMTPIALTLEPDLRLLGFTAAISVFTGILFGLAPAFLATRTDLVRSVRSGGARPGKLLTVAQVALSLMLLIVAGLFVRSLSNLTARTAGAMNEHVLVTRVEPRGSDQRNMDGVSARLDRIYRDLAARAELIPGVQSASLAQFTPSTVRGASGEAVSEAGERIPVYVPMIYPRFFATAGIELKAGRDLKEADLSPDSPLVAVVNEEFARRLFPGDTNPVGRRYRMWGELREVVGVVRDSRLSDVRSDRAPAIAYQSFLQTRTGRGQMALYVRTAGSPAAILPRVRAAVQAIDPTMPMFEIRTLAGELDAVLVRERLLAMLSGLFGVVAVVLACIGLYGLFSFHVVRRTREMAIRKAIGAGSGAVVWSVMREVLGLIAVGIAVGVPAAIACQRLAASRIAGLLFGLTAQDPATIAGAAATLALVAAAAGYLPARRASRVDPMAALRTE